MNAKLLIPAALALASAVEGQIPITPMQCGGVRALDASGQRELQPRSFAIQDRGFCSEYTVGAGIENTIQLHLGEGAHTYLDQVFGAAEIWRDALFGGRLANGVDFPIRISHARPRRFNVSESVWMEGESISDSNINDGQSVIYFKSSGNVDTGTLGFTRIRKSGSRILEADIYINTVTEDKHGTNLARPRLVFEVDEEHGVYSFLNGTFINVLHEMGHALGLAHIRIKGNAMSYQYTEHPTIQWEAAMGMFVLNQLALIGPSAYSDPTQIPFVFRKDHVSPYMIVRDEAMLESMAFFTGSARLGEQDKTALMCLYDF